MPEANKRLPESERLQPLHAPDRSVPHLGNDLFEVYLKPLRSIPEASQCSNACESEKNRMGDQVSFVFCCSLFMLFRDVLCSVFVSPHFLVEPNL